MSSPPAGGAWVGARARLANGDWPLSVVAGRLEEERGDAPPVIGSLELARSAAMIGCYRGSVDS